jgi:AcrR family transcriptional regulator
MARTYQLKRRAERQQDTRQRIVEAAVALHTTVGPSRTTVSAIAERAGVQRHTFYRHFPDDRSLNLACSGLFQERHPLPDAKAWRSLTNPLRRLRRGIGDLYEFYEQNGGALAPIFRDLEVDPGLREVVTLRMRQPIDAMVETLAEPFRLRGARERRFVAALRVFMDFTVWRALRSSTESPTEAAEAAVRAICAQ